ncbi:anhydro-N-acetylmuramic acid kinase [Methylorubrum populi]|jgi:anhydro-N-acetylmuramic acid kinase|uniref:Anhydro-N-acetylmuramic acid kinase n=1 Tax=Methylorubrum rhodesianum TaxID=29427 RepID=A0ABU9ZEB9_9HYPH|nr:anhydro-N-acetylmuramic acid kinase [Methylorubrum rhodesianum]MBK3405807.1 anhydro-N-acetylmuramic acid kinase [Methylorubrum rhodesianum]MBY0140694.1 anhydro-N-acetylmuramic acid kinase [Methylorubrum populi]
MAMKRAIGLMSGTSLDGIDVALIESDGERVRVVKSANGFIDPLGPTGYRGYSEAEKTLLREATRDAEAIDHRNDRPGRLPEAEDFVTRAHAEAIEAFLAANGLSAADIDIVGFHGQTVIHRPKLGLTVQIGDGAALARRLGIRVVSDLRANDVAEGGQGAPLVPVFHKALAEAAGFAGPLGILNIGGLANATLIDSSGTMLAFDTGPGNGPINDWMKERTGRDFDEDGATAARGRVDEELLENLLGHPLILRAPPKSLDRNWFSHRLAGYLTVEDGAATLTAFAAHAVARSLAFASERPTRWIVGGGGARNRTLMAMLERLLEAEVMNADAIGWSSDFLEAQAFAYLALRALEGLPLTYPTTTGVAAPVTGGIVCEP